jgi:hypothetical protein
MKFHHNLRNTGILEYGGTGIMERKEDGIMDKKRP